MRADLDYLAYLARESARFGEVLRGLPADAPVPACPDWNADDLLWHLGEVQWFWGTVVREGLPGAAVGERAPERPPDRAGLAAFYERVSRDLGTALAEAAPETPAWTWSTDHTVGFIRRRQAHEALIHRVDAEEAAGDRTPMDAALASDGVDEVLRVMYGGLPAWATFTPQESAAVRLEAADTGDAWTIVLGRFTGTDPEDGTAHDEPGLGVVSDAGTDAAAVVQGTAADLDCWLWHRSTMGNVERSGDPAVLSRFESAIAAGID
ncbi:MAG TPA: maleylpyruvate isomerase family mycothiol-dependent enzyme [Streptosporangiaceae bacterium]